MARKDNIEEDYISSEQSEKPKQLFKKEDPEEQSQIQIVSDSELLHIKLNQINAKLDEILSLAK